MKNNLIQLLRGGFRGGGCADASFRNLTITNTKGSPFWTIYLIFSKSAFGAGVFGLYIKQILRCENASFLYEGVLPDGEFPSEFVVWKNMWRFPCTPIPQKPSQLHSECVPKSHSSFCIAPDWRHPPSDCMHC